MNLDKEPTETEATVEEQETQSDFDTEAAVADISSELFGQGSEEGKVEKPAEGEAADTSGGPSADAVETPPQTDEEKAAAEAAKAEETSADVQAVGAPKTWTKEALEKWATVDPVVQAEIAKREDDFLKGITQYRAAAQVGDRYSKILEPYAPIMAAEKIDPDQIMQAFAANHYLLTKGTPQQKIELAASMLTGYQIPLPELLNFMADSLDAEPANPTVVALQKEVGELRNLVSTRATAEQTAVTKRIDDEIEAFASDPSHPYFNELADDIQKLFAGGMANTLAEAYEKAVYANPTTRQKELDRLKTENETAASVEAKARKKAASSATDVKVTPKSRDGTVPTGSIDDTLEETMAAIQSRG